MDVGACPIFLGPGGGWDSGTEKYESGCTRGPVGANEPTGVGSELIANVPVGQVPVTVGNKLVQVSCHTRELSLPYYVLLMGTRGEVHTSMTTRYKQDDHTRMMELPDLE